MSFPLIVVLMGPPGAGKGTHAGPLSAYLNIPHISTGDLFRENIRNQTPIGIQATDYMNQGKLVPDQLVFEMLFQRTDRKDCREGYILDGFPRTLRQAKTFDQQIENAHPLVIYFHVSDDLLVERIAARLACSQCGKPYHKKYDPPKCNGACDSCNAALYQREDDKEEILRKRLEIYHKETAPLIEYYSGKDLLKEVDGGNSKERVFQDVLGAIPHTAVLK